VKVAGCERIVCWGGGGGDHHSHRWIWHGIYQTARKLGMGAKWIWDDPRGGVQPGDLVFCIDIWSEHLPLIEGARYVCHNIPGDHPLFTEIPERDWIRWQVYTNEAAGEKVGCCRYWLAENRTLSMPWGTDLLAEEFYDPVFNPSSREAMFVGAIWNTDGQGNEGILVELRHALKMNGLKLVHKTQISGEDMINSIRGARIAPAIAGDWQVDHDYLPCRVFKNVSYGQVAITNVQRFFDIFADCSLQADSVEGLIGESLSLRRGEWVEMVMAQQKIVSQFTYRESLATIDKVFGG